MRALKDYPLSHWLVGAPLAHRLRRLRNTLVDRIYRRRRAPGQEALVRALADQGGTLAFTVAFNTPEAVALLMQAMARHLPGTPLVVCDNSTQAEARAAIAALCAARGVAYCALPPSPYRGGRNGSRSHAVALNWILANLIRPAAPKVFALIDHDLIPLAPVDLAATVARQPCYGMVRTATEGPGWYLWPGYSVFDYEAVKDLPLDFGTDTPLTLDTGGQNWGVLYRGLDRDALSWATVRTVFVSDAETGTAEPHLMADAWLHAGGAGHGWRDRAFNAVRKAFEADPDGLYGRLRLGARHRAGAGVGA
ncbi:hypothetical protein V5F53_00570 [Xanthobacter sp. V4C-4]|uniref:hypothetical protein n=1 Tax=Xanthobacter cornucopiae TaxID=3119924 RepID=UPI00372B8127